MKKLLHDWFTGPNNDNFEMARAGYFAAVVTALALTIHAAVTGAGFDIMTFGQGIGTLLVTGGLGVGAKDLAANKAKAWASPSGGAGA